MRQQTQHDGFYGTTRACVFASADSTKKKSQAPRDLAFRLDKGDTYTGTAAACWFAACRMNVRTCDRMPLPRGVAKACTLARGDGKRLNHSASSIGTPAWLMT